VSGALVAGFLFLGQRVKIVFELNKHRDLATVLHRRNKLNLLRSVNRMSLEDLYSFFGVSFGMTFINVRPLLVHWM